MTAKRRPRPYGDDLLDRLRERMLMVRARLAREYDALAGEALRPSGQESGFETPADYGSDTFEEEIAVGQLEDRSRVLFDLEEALARIDGRGAYEYGLCERCADEPLKLCATCPWIAPARLRYEPWARTCIAVQERLERGGQLGERQGEHSGEQPKRTSMQITNVPAIEKTVQKTVEWLDALTHHLNDPDRERAYHALRATLHALRDRLPIQESVHLAAQLPSLVRGVFYEGWRPSAAPLPLHGRDEFLHHVGRELVDPSVDEETAVRAVFALLAARVSAGEIEDVKHVLPQRIRELWPERP